MNRGHGLQGSCVIRSDTSYKRMCDKLIAKGNIPGGMMRNIFRLFWVKGEKEAEFLASSWYFVWRNDLSCSLLE
jgi:hypothetical protein